MDLHIQFTTKDAKADGSIPFLDTIAMPQPDNSLLTSVYRNGRHTYLYLQWGSHHHPSAKFSVINTLKHRAKTVCSNNQLLKEEEDHPNKALRRCKYPVWPLNRASIKQKNDNWTNQDSGISKNNTGSNNSKPYTEDTYVKGRSENCKTSAENMALKCTSKEAVPSRISWYTSKIKTPSFRKKGWSTDIKMAGWTVRKSIWGNQAEHLQKGSENIWGPPHPSMITTTPLAMTFLWKISA